MPVEPPSPPTEPNAAITEFRAAAALEHYRARLKESARDRDAETEAAKEAAKAGYANVYRERWWAVDDEFYEHLYDFVKGGVERTRSAAETVQKAASALATLYGVALGVSFSVTDDSLPRRGVIPLLFLGLSIVASTAYLAWIGDRSTTINTLGPETEAKSSLRQRLYADEFTTLVASVGQRRASSLRASVVALAIGLFALPAPFVDLSGKSDSARSPEASESSASGSTLSVSTGSESALAWSPASSIATSESTLPMWPAPSDFEGYSPEVGAALMEAQAAEVAALRAKALAGENETSGTDWWPPSGWVVVTVVGLMVVALIWINPKWLGRAPLIGRVLAT